jgi:glycosyltransferase involved in cell wall biosynthesis
MKKNILFVGHDANRAGAQILLLRFLKLLKNHPDFEFTVLLKTGGVLVEEYQQVTETILWDAPARIPTDAEKWKNKLGIKKIEPDLPINRLPKKKFDLIVSNTVTNGDILPELVTLGCPIITYCHELEMGIRMYTSPQNFANVLKFSTSYIACGVSVKENLIKNHKIKEEKIVILPSLLSDEAYNFKTDYSKIFQVRKELGAANQKTLLIGGMGTIDLRKGVDMFVQLAKSLDFKDFQFVWIGGSKDQAEYKIFEVEIEKMEMKKFILKESVSNPLDYMAAFDVFMLLSREDPYPLVMLEAALLERPIIAFDKSGGAKDFVERDCGHLIEYLNVAEIPNKLVKLGDNQSQRATFGQNGRKKVLERHNQDVAFQKFVEILKSL